MKKSSSNHNRGVATSQKSRNIGVVQLNPPFIPRLPIYRGLRTTRGRVVDTYFTTVIDRSYPTYKPEDRSKTAEFETAKKNTTPLPKVIPSKATDFELGEKAVTALQHAISIDTNSDELKSLSSFQKAKRIRGPLGTLSILPAEIRNVIYGYVLFFDYDDEVPYRNSTKFIGAMKNIQSFFTIGDTLTRTGLLTTSKQVHSECIPILFKVNKFVLWFVPRYTIDCRYSVLYPKHFMEENENERFRLAVSMENIHRHRAFYVKKYRPTLPSKFKKYLHLVRCWDLCLPIPLYNKTDIVISKTFSFLTDFANASYLLDSVQIGSEGRPEPLNQRVAEDRGSMLVERLMMFRGLQGINKISVADLSLDGYDYTPEFKNHISETVQLPVGIDVKPFRGQKFFMKKCLPEGDPSEVQADLRRAKVVRWFEDLEESVKDQIARYVYANSWL